VTHDQREAFATADRVAVLLRGHIAQIDAPQTVYTQPATPGVAEFLGLGANVVGNTLLHPNALRVASTDTPDALRGVVAACVFTGERFHLRAACDDGGTLLFYSDTPVPVGTTVYLKAEHIHVFPKIT
jgi:ABC-type sulfate/molybdate transport systems ATPase subunit